MRVDQLIGDHRMRLMSVVEQASSVRAGCRLVGIHPSTYYRWRKQVETDGPDGLVPKRSRTRVRTAARVRLEAEVVALALANPPWGPRRLFYELGRRGVAAGSETQVWRILRAHGLNRRGLRYRTMAIARGLAIAEHSPPAKRPNVGVLAADWPGDLVQMDCFHIGRLKESRMGAPKTQGTVWQYTAIDVASSFVWAELHTSAHNPSSVHTSALARRVADDLARWGWHLHAVSTDRGKEFTARQFTKTLIDHDITHRLIRAGRPQSNGKVEQVHNTILQECWKPVFMNYVQPSISGLRLDLAAYLDHYNTQRPHGGKWNNGQPPTTIIHPKPAIYP